MVNDPVADLITRIRNATLRQATSLRLPASRLTEAIATAMLRTGYLSDVRRVHSEPQDQLELTLKYTNGLNAIHSIVQVSKRGLRRYSSYKTLRSPRHGGGILLLSTPLGVLSDREARSKGVGGELLCEIHS